MKMLNILTQHNTTVWQAHSHQMTLRRYGQSRCSPAVTACWMF